MEAEEQAFCSDPSVKKKMPEQEQPGGSGDAPPEFVRSSVRYSMPSRTLVGDLEYILADICSYSTLKVLLPQTSYSGEAPILLLVLTKQQ